MAVISTGLRTMGYRTQFNVAMAGIQPELLYPRISTRVVSTADMETYKHLGMVPIPRLWGTGREAKDLRTESYTITNQKYELTIAVDRDELADCQSDLITGRIRELAVAVATHPDYLMANLINNGDQATYIGPDGQVFFSAAHTFTGATTTQTNLSTSNVVTANRPTPDECRDAVSEAFTVMAAFKDDHGRPIVPGGATYTIVVPQNMLFSMREAINPTSVLAPRLFSDIAINVIPCPWLTALNSALDERFYLFRNSPNISVGPFMFQDREPIEFGSFDQTNSEHGFMQEQFLYGVRARYAVAYGQWFNGVQHILT